MSRGNKILITGFSLIGLILIYLFIMYFVINGNKLTGKWTFIKYNVYENNKLINSFDKNNEISLIFNEQKIKSVINIDIKNEIIYYYKTNDDKLYYSVNEINDEYDEFNYYFYKISNDKLYVYIENNQIKYEYVFVRV